MAHRGQIMVKQPCRSPTTLGLEKGKYFYQAALNGIRLAKKNQALLDQLKARMERILIKQMLQFMVQLKTVKQT